MNKFKHVSAEIKNQVMDEILHLNKIKKQLQSCQDQDEAREKRRDIRAMKLIVSENITMLKKLDLHSYFLENERKAEALFRGMTFGSNDMFNLWRDTKLKIKRHQAIIDQCLKFFNQ